MVALDKEDSFADKTASICVSVMNHANKLPTYLVRPDSWQDFLSSFSKLSSEFLVLCDSVTCLCSSSLMM